MSASKIRVLVVDDSHTARVLLTAGLTTDPNIEVIGTAEDPYEAWNMVRSLRPDVITLDINMPRMDGIEFLGRLLPRYPVPVVMVSSDGSESATLRALAAGAVDFVAKPGGQAGYQVMFAELRARVRMASTCKVCTADVSLHRAPKTQVRGCTQRLVAIGASTGGTKAIEAVLRQLPEGMPPIVITQHMPAGYTAKFARRLDGCLPLNVVEGEDGMALEPGMAVVAPGGLHMTVRKRDTQLVVRCQAGEKVQGHAPSVDVLFNSTVKAVGSMAVAALLTGMGRDGAAGMKAMKAAGALTVCQDQATSVVFGMPRAAIALNAHTEIKPLESVGATLVGFLTDSRAETHRRSA